MKLLAMADLHGHLPDVKDVAGTVDAVVVAGDIAPDFIAYRGEKIGGRVNEQSDWLDVPFRTWATSLRKPVYGCYGNHDFGTMTKKHTRIHLGDNEICGNFFLFGWSCRFGPWNYMAGDVESDGASPQTIEEKLAVYESLPDIWVVHGPPYGKGDNHGLGQEGSRALLAAIEKHNPKVVVCGHLHEGERESTIGVTRIYNVSLRNDQYAIVNKPVIIEV